MVPCVWTCGAWGGVLPNASPSAAESVNLLSIPLKRMSLPARLGGSGLKPPRERAMVRPLPGSPVRPG